MIIHQADKGKIKGLHKVTNSHRSCFSEGKEYASTYTQRQQDIIDCQYVPNLRRKEIKEIMNKAKSMEDYELADTVYELYEDVLVSSSVMPSEAEVVEARDYLDKIKEELLK